MESTVRAAMPARSPALEGTVTLRVCSGPDAGKTLVVDDAMPTRILVGRSPSCELRVDDPSVSRRHAAIEIVEGKLRVTDLDSTNGTWVHDVAIVGAYLRGGEKLRFGEIAVSVERGNGATATVPTRDRFGRVFGHSREMRRLYPLCERLAASKVPVLVEGETGTGKEALAESLHEEGPRRDKPFVVFDCTAVAPSLLEAELFGHEKGAFTGATSARPGVFEQADGGTLLIDEIGDLDLQLQPKLLRALDRQECRRVGGTSTIRFDVRILAATRRDLDKEVQAGRFRDDLFHRLAVARIELPPLRGRRGDIPLLVHAIALRLGGDVGVFTPELLAQWEDFAWPGNVRELRNAVARRLELGELADWQAEARDPTEPHPAPSAEGETSRALAHAIDEILATELPIAEARRRMISEFESRYLLRILDAHGGNVTRAAEASGIARRHFHRLMRSRGTRSVR